MKIVINSLDELIPDFISGDLLLGKPKYNEIKKYYSVNSYYAGFGRLKLVFSIKKLLLRELAVFNDLLLEGSKKVFSNYYVENINYRKVPASYMDNTYYLNIKVKGSKIMEPDKKKVDLDQKSKSTQPVHHQVGNITYRKITSKPVSNTKDKDIMNLPRNFALKRAINQVVVQNTRINECNVKRRKYY